MVQISNDDVIKQYNDNRDSRARYQKAFDSVSSWFQSDEEKQERVVQDMRQATVDAQKRATQKVYEDQAVNAASELEKEKAALEAEAQWLKWLTEYSDEYNLALKKLNDKKFSFDEKVKTFNSTVTSLDKHTAWVEYMRMQRGPFAEYFADDKSSDVFLDTYIKPFAIDNEGKNKLWTPEWDAKRQVATSMLSSIMSNTQDKVNELIREGVIKTPEEYYLGDEFKSMAQQLLGKVDNFVDKNGSKIIGKNGMLDGKAVAQALEDDSDFSEALNSYEKYREWLDENIAQLRMGNNKTLLSKAWGFITRGFDYVLDKGINEGLEKASSFFSDDNTSFFGDEEKKELIAQTAWEDGVIKMLQRGILANPADIGLVGLELAAAFIPGLQGYSAGALATRLWSLWSKLARLDRVGRRADDTLDVAKLAVTGNEVLDTSILWTAKVVNRLKRSVPHVAEEIVKSVPISYTIDSWTWEYGNAGLNTLFDGLPWLFTWAIKWVNGVVDSIFDGVQKIDDVAKKADYLKQWGVSVDASFDFANKEEVAKSVKQAFTAMQTSVGQQRVLGLQYITDAIKDNPQLYNEAFYKDFYNGVVKNMDILSSANTNAVKNIVKQANDILISPVEQSEKLTKLADLTVNYFDNIGAEYIAKEVNRQVKTVVANSLTAQVSSTLQKSLEIGKADADLLATKFWFNVPSSPEHLLDIAAKEGVNLSPNVVASQQDVISDIAKAVQSVKNEDNMVWYIATKALGEDGLSATNVNMQQKFKDIMSWSYGKKAATAEQLWKAQEWIDEMYALAGKNGGGAQKIDLDGYISYISKYIPDKATQADVISAYGKISKAYREALEVGDANYFDVIGKGVNELIAHLSTVSKQGDTFGKVLREKYITITPTTYENIFGSDFYKQFSYLIDAEYNKKWGWQKIYRAFVKYAHDNFLLEPERFAELIAYQLNSFGGTADQKAYVSAWLQNTYNYVARNSELLYDTMFSHYMTHETNIAGLDNVIDNVQIAKVANDVGVNIQETPIWLAGVIDGLRWKELSQYQKALIDGVGTPGGFNVPNLHTVATNIDAALTKGVPYEIPFAYMNRDGVDLLQTMFVGKSGFVDLLQKSYSSGLGKVNNVWAMIMQSFFSEWKLAFSTTIGGNQVSLFDILNSLPPRLSESVFGLKNKWWVIFAPLLTLSKYLFKGDKAFFDTYLAWIGEFFEQKRKFSSGFWKIADNFLSKFDGAYDNIGDAMKYVFEETTNRIKEVTGIENIDEIMDVTHPLLYSPEEYVLQISRYNGSPDKDLISSVAFELLNRRSAVEIFGSDTVLRAKGQLIPEVQELPAASLAGYSVRNANATALETYMRSFVQSRMDAVSVGTQEVWSFLYKTFWYGLYTGGLWYTTDVFKLFGNYIFDWLRANGLWEDVVNGLKAIFSKLYVYTEDGKILGWADKIASEAKSYLKSIGQDTDGMDTIVDQYIKAVTSYNKSDITNLLVWDMMKKFSSSTLVTTENIGEVWSTPFISSTEQSEAFARSVFEAQRQELDKAAVRIIGNVIEEGAWDLEKWVNITRMGKLLGMSKAQMVKAIVSAGYSDEIAKEIVASGKLTSKQVLDGLAHQVKQGNIDAAMLFRNKVFSSAIAKTIADSWVRESVGVWYDVSKDGDIVLRNNTAWGAWEEVFKAIVPLNTQALFDQETAYIFSKYTDVSNTGRIYTPSQLFVQWRKFVSIKSYLYKAQDALKSFVLENKITLEEYKNLAQKVWSSGNKDELFSTITHKWLRGLAERLFAYKEDIVRFRGEAIPYTEYLTDGDTINDVINRLGGRRVYFSNADIARLEKKYAPSIDGTSWGKFRWSILGNFMVDTFYKWLFDQRRDSMFGLWNKITKAVMLLLYNLPFNAGKWIQQLVTNTVHADSLVAAYGFDSKKLDWLIDFIDKRLNYSVFGAQKANIELWSEWSTVNRLFTDLITKSSALYWWDKLSQWNAIKSSLVQALYPYYDQLWENGINTMLNNIEEYKWFTEKFEVSDFDFANRYVMQQKIIELSKTPDEDLLQYEILRRFYKETYEPILSTTRAALGTFYVTDNVRELGAIRLIENNRFLFPFKKWAFGKMGEYGLRLASEYKKAGWEKFIWKLLSGDMPVLNMMARDVARTLKLWWASSKMTGGEFEVQDFMYQMSIPFVVASMVFGDAITRGFRTAADYKEVTDNIWSSTAVFFTETLANTFSTAFFYHDYFLKSIEEAVKTGATFEEENDKLGVMVETFWKSTFLDAWTKFFKDQYRWIYMDTDMDGSISSNAVETLLNIQGSKRKDYQRLIDEVYTTSNASEGWLLSYIGNLVVRRLPLVRMLVQGQGTYLQPIIDSLESYSKEKKLDYLTNPYAAWLDPEGVSDLIDNIEINDFVAKSLSEDSNFLVDTDNAKELYEKAIESGAVWEDLAMMTKVISLLKYQSGDLAKWIKLAATEDYDPEQVAALSDQFLQIVLTKTKKKSFNIESAVQEFIALRSDVGTNIPLWMLLSAMNSAARKQAIAAVTWWDEDSEKAIGINKNSQEYKDFIVTYRAAQKWILKSTWGMIANNAYVGQELKKTYLFNARDLPFNRDSGINSSNIIAHIAIAQDMQDVIERDGYPSDEFMNRLNLVYKNNLETLQWFKSKNKAVAYEKIIGVGNKILQSIEDWDGSPQTKAMAKMWFSYTLLPFLNDIKSASPKSLEEILQKLKTPFTQLLDTITQATPVAEKEAIITALDLPVGWWSWNGKSRWVLKPLRKAQENTHRIMEGVEKVRQLAMSIKSDFNLPWVRASTIYSAPRGGKINKVTSANVSIAVPKVPIPKIGPVEGWSSRTQQLGTPRITKSSLSSRKVYKPKASKAAKYFSNVSRWLI